MFTGIIEEIGKVSHVTPIAGGKKFDILADHIPKDTNVKDSISVNGVCLTVTNIDRGILSADAVGVTLIKSGLNRLSVGDFVNLERSVRPIDRLGGHLVQGHINGISRISRIEKMGENFYLTVEIPKGLNKYVVPEGSIALDGVSLTIAEVNQDKIGISIIPYTWANTTLKYRKIGDSLNVETDIIAKYIEKLIQHPGSSEKEKLTFNRLKDLGY